MKTYQITIQGDRIPVRIQMNAESFQDVIRQIEKHFQWDKLKLTRMTNKISLVIEKQNATQS